MVKKVERTNGNVEYFLNRNHPELEGKCDNGRDTKNFDDQLGEKQALAPRPHRGPGGLHLSVPSLQTPQERPQSRTSSLSWKSHNQMGGMGGRKAQ